MYVDIDLNCIEEFRKHFGKQNDWNLGLKGAQSIRKYLSAVRHSKVPNGSIVPHFATLTQTQLWKEGVWESEKKSK